MIWLTSRLSALYGPTPAVTSPYAFTRLFPAPSSVNIHASSMTRIYVIQNVWVDRQGLVQIVVGCAVFNLIHMLYHGA